MPWTDSSYPYLEELALSPTFDHPRENELIPNISRRGTPTRAPPTMDIPDLQCRLQSHYASPRFRCYYQTPSQARESIKYEHRLDRHSQGGGYPMTTDPPLHCRPGREKSVHARKHPYHRCMDCKRLRRIRNAEDRRKRVVYDGRQVALRQIRTRWVPPDILDVDSWYTSPRITHATTSSPSDLAFTHEDVVLPRLQYPVPPTDSIESLSQTSLSRYLLKAPASTFTPVSPRTVLPKPSPFRPKESKPLLRPLELVKEKSTHPDTKCVLPSYWDLERRLMAAELLRHPKFQKARLEHELNQQDGPPEFWDPFASHPTILEPDEGVWDGWTLTSFPT